MLQRTLQLLEPWRAAPWPCEGVHPWGLARPSQRPSLLPGELSAAVPQRRDQLLHGTSGSGRAAAGTIAKSYAARGIPGPVGSFTMFVVVDATLGRTERGGPGDLATSLWLERVAVVEGGSMWPIQALRVY